MKAPRLRRDAREMRKEREKREVEKNKKRKKKKKRGLLARTIGSLAGCTRARNYVSRLACGLEKRQQRCQPHGRIFWKCLEIQKQTNLFLSKCNTGAKRAGIFCCAAGELHKKAKTSF